MQNFAKHTLPQTLAPSSSVAPIRLELPRVRSEAPAPPHPVVPPTPEVGAMLGINDFPPSASSLGADVNNRLGEGTVQVDFYY